MDLSRSVKVLIVGSLTWNRDIFFLGYNEKL